MSGMELLEWTLIIVPVIIAGALSWRWITLADARARIELQKRLQKSRESSSAHARKREMVSMPDQGDQIGNWVPGLLEEFGIDPDVIFEDEMPQELKRFLPVVKGFVQNGGIQKILGGAGNQEQGSQNERSAI